MSIKTRGITKGRWRRGMELNHQIRLCRPFPFLFGFRALLSEPRRQSSVRLSIRFIECSRAIRVMPHHFPKKLLFVTLRLGTEGVGSPPPLLPSARLHDPYPWPMQHFFKNSRSAPCSSWNEKAGHRGVRPPGNPSFSAESFVKRKQATISCSCPAWLAND